MAVKVLTGERFDGVAFGTAPGTDPGYVIGFTPLVDEPLLRVHETDCPASLVGVKYYHHPVGDSRGADRPANELFALTMLVSDGSWRQRVWSEESGESVEVLLAAPGDFIAWRPGLKHSWYPVQASTMLTVRWRRRAERG
jgi:hypothetical protein